MLRAEGLLLTLKRKTEGWVGKFWGHSEEDEVGEGEMEVGLLRAKIL